ncbi:MAG: hypothetical protein ACTSRN_07330 [Alphaproteobacteria bacterium]
MKLVALTAAITAAASTAIAGTVTYVAPVVPTVMVEETGSMGGSGAWLIPLLAIALIALAVSRE